MIIRFEIQVEYKGRREDKGMRKLNQNKKLET